MNARGRHGSPETPLLGVFVVGGLGIETFTAVCGPLGLPQAVAHRHVEWTKTGTSNDKCCETLFVRLVPVKIKPSICWMCWIYFFSSRSPKTIDFQWFSVWGWISSKMRCSFKNKLIQNVDFNLNKYSALRGKNLKKNPKIISRNTHEWFSTAEIKTPLTSKSRFPP